MESNKNKIDYRQLGTTDLKLPVLSFGCAPLGNLFDEISDKNVYDTLNYAWHSGINYFDVAPEYGHGLAERRLGDFLRSKPKDQYYLSTKVGRVLSPNQQYDGKENKFINALPFDLSFDYSYDGVMRSFENSLHRLGLASVDIVYMHDLGTIEHGDNHSKYFDQAVTGGFKAVDELRSQKCIKAIGLGVKEWQVCTQSFEYLDFDCFMINGFFNLLNQDLIEKFLPECRKRNISINYAGPFASGILATGAIDGAVYQYHSANNEVLKRVSSIEKICIDYNIPLAAAALQFPMHHPAITSVVTGMRSSSEVSRNIDNLSKKIPLEFWYELKQQGLLHNQCQFH